MNILTEDEVRKLRDRLERKLGAVRKSLVGSANMPERMRRHKVQIEIPEVEDALTRLNGGSIGICEICEESISFQRLMLRPETRYCTPCLSDLEA